VATDPTLIHSQTTILSRISPTPQVRPRWVTKSPSNELFLKLEWFNPFRSTKDRTALFLHEGLDSRVELDSKQLV
jgi:cysteine synthase